MVQGLQSTELFLLAGMEQWWGRGEMVGMGPESGALRVVLSSFAQLGLAFPVRCRFRVGVPCV